MIGSGVVQRVVGLDPTGFREVKIFEFEVTRFSTLDAEAKRGDCARRRLPE